MLFPGLVLLAIAVTSPAAQPVPIPKTTGSTGSDHSTVRVFTRREGETTHFLVENRELCEVTMTFEMSLEKLKANVALPLTAAFPPGQITEAFSVTPVTPDADWAYDYTTYFKLGNREARHDDACVYELPYSPGESVEVTQGYNGQFSHQGSNKYAIDWDLAEGTLVRAARGGLVVRVKDDSDRGGGSIEFDRYNNYVLIRHADGTLGQYCHLQKDGALVKPGQTVAAGEPIAHSGNTGFTTGPHLHFCVFTTKSGRERASIPVRFRTAEGPALTLLSGHTYQAAHAHLAHGKAGVGGSFSLPGPAPARPGGKARTRSLVSLWLEFFHLDR